MKYWKIMSQQLCLVHVTDLSVLYVLYVCGWLWKFLNFLLPSGWAKKKHKKKNEENLHNYDWNVSHRCWVFFKFFFCIFIWLICLTMEENSFKVNATSVFSSSGNLRSIACFHYAVDVWRKMVALLSCFLSFCLFVWRSCDTLSET